ncbi:hypothetical protein T11_12053 [Trichinella zimbabwensis]|uniref:Uncharacterized protein n=1 Tax=Trichinella zimbabwensis TaxID=268475 RepID=A0A0V1GV97_9BILA|nr:hypothetical protein T11_12053 [Trichinella zimbabwensis]
MLLNSSLLTLPDLSQQLGAHIHSISIIRKLIFLPDSSDTPLFVLLMTNLQTTKINMETQWSLRSSHRILLFVPAQQNRSKRNGRVANLKTPCIVKSISVLHFHKSIVKSEKIDPTLRYAKAKGAYTRFSYLNLYNQQGGTSRLAFTQQQEQHKFYGLLTYHRSHDKMYTLLNSVALIELQEQSYLQHLQMEFTKV